MVRVQINGASPKGCRDYFTLGQRPHITEGGGTTMIAPLKPQLNKYVHYKDVLYRVSWTKTQGNELNITENDWSQCFMLVNSREDNYTAALI